MSDPAIFVSSNYVKSVFVSVVRSQFQLTVIRGGRSEVVVYKETTDYGHLTPAYLTSDS